MEQRGLERIPFFSDAVVAIALTLLVLPLVELGPELGRHGNVADLLSDNRDKLLSFFISFVVIARYWSVHHRMLRDVIGYNGHLVRLNFVWLLGVVFLPFPTELIGASGQDTTGVGLYIGTLMITSLALLLQVQLINRTPGLQLEGARINPVPFAATVGSMVIALGLVIAVPSIGLWALLLLIPSNLIDGTNRPRSEPAA